MRIRHYRESLWGEILRIPQVANSLFVALWKHSTHFEFFAISVRNAKK